LKHLNLKKGDGILLPEYICDVVTHPIKQLKLEQQFYKINDNFTIKWQELERLVTSNTKAILMVHFFGQPQDITNYLSFCKKNNLYLIEDNAHGYGGKVNNQELGTFGDIGISSPRKIIDVNSGGVLWVKNGEFNYPKNIIKYPITLKDIFKKNINKINLKYKNILIKKIKSRPKYEDPSAFSESIINDYFIDDYSYKIINELNIDKIRLFRQNEYKKLENFAKNNNLKPVIEKLHKSACPWFFPAYSKDSIEAQKWFKWGWENNQLVFSWPSLPQRVITKNGESLKRWQRLICFGINPKMNN
jgi:hypothetical protein